ncbi:hypothetical protein NW212_12005 [Bacteroides sp. ET225]|nr:hypothetical protein [Bacteroides sp. ET225]
MGKKQNQKRKTQLNAKTRMESFRFQVMWEKNRRMPELPDESLNTELDVLCEKGLVDEMLVLRDIVEGVRKELGYQTEMGKGSLEGTVVPFLLGITTTEPDLAQPNNVLSDAEHLRLPLEVVLYYDNEIRNRVVDWVKLRYETVKTQLGQPILKRSNMVVEFKRVMKS